jgi:amino acid transporter
MAAEVLSVAAKRQDMPAFLARENANQVPSMALLMSTLLVQAVLIATLFSDDAFTFALSLCSHLSLIPYFLSAAFALMLVYRKETYETDPSDLRKDTIIAVLASLSSDALSASMASPPAISASRKSMGVHDGQRKKSLVWCALRSWPAAQGPGLFSGPCSYTLDPVQLRSVAV